MIKKEMDQLLDALFPEEEAQEVRVETIPISRMVPFKDHPFKVLEGEELDRLKESIEKSGVLVPVLVRPKEGGCYEMISGHRRMAACKALGIPALPAVVKDLSDEEAVIVMVDANLQREHILPSEKAFAYKMKMDAMKRSAGRPSADNASQLGTQKRTDQIMAEEQGESRNQIQRYIRLTNLIPGLLDLVDKGEIALTTAVALSYLRPHEQEWVHDSISYEECTPSLSQACRMKTASQAGRLRQEDVFLMMQEDKPNQRETVKLSKEELSKYFPDYYTTSQIKVAILQALDTLQQQKNRDDRDAR